MRFVNLGGRGSLLAPGGVVDIADASGGDLPSEPIELLRRWSDLVHAFRALSSREATPLDEARLRSPVPRPGSIFGLVANYPPATRPDAPVPMVFGKFPNSVCGPYELPDPHDLVIECRLNGEMVQKASTAELLFDVPELIEFLSAFVTLVPGDVILTGTPTPLDGQLPRLSAGHVVETSIADVGTMRNRCVADTL